MNMNINDVLLILLILFIILPIYLFIQNKIDKSNKSKLDENSKLNKTEDNKSEDFYQELHNLKDKLNTDCTSGIVSLGLILLNWYVENIDKGYKINAISEEGDIKECPLIYKKGE